MIEKVIIFAQGFWIPDPQKLAKTGWHSAVIADRIGPEDIEKAVKAAEITNQNWKHYIQDGTELVSHHNLDVIEEFSQIGCNFYLNQYIEYKDAMAFWMPEFSEFSVIMFSNDLIGDLGDFLMEVNKDLKEWIESDFWTAGERAFILDGISKYTVLPQV
jgi:hypothetical protein